jgi:hypothetical protein
MCCNGSGNRDHPPDCACFACRADGIKRHRPDCACCCCQPALFRKRRCTERWGYPWLTQRSGRCFVRFWNQRIIQTRFIWRLAHGPIPKGHVIHHWNLDPLDDRLSNLRCWTIGKHRGFHGCLIRFGHATTPDGEHVILTPDGALIIVTS